MVQTKRPSISQIEDKIDVSEKTAELSEQVYLRIKEWRAQNKALVDTHGAESHYKREDPPNEQAFQVMVGDLLSV